MPQYLRIPRERLPAETLTALLEEYASRDGTDYGLHERSLEEKVASLSAQLDSGDLYILFETESEDWDLVPREQAVPLLEESELT